jgi:hypothetical protein
MLRADPPASEEDVSALATREAFALPPDYRALLLVADGLEVGRLVVLGTRDAYRLDIAGPPRLVIVPPDEDGALTLDEAGAVIHVAIDADTSAGILVAPDIRHWLTTSLSKRTRTAT